MRYLLPALAAVLLSCAAPRFAERATLPAIRSEWPAVRALAVRGSPLIEPACATMDGAVAAGNVSTMLSVLPPIETAAAVGVAERVRAGEIGEHGGGLAREQVAQFGRAVRSLGGAQ